MAKETSRADAEAGPPAATIGRLTNGVYAAAALLAGMELDLFTPLADGPLTGEALAAALGVDAARLEPLLYALAAIGLLAVEDGRFANTSEADRYLVRGRPDFAGGQPDLVRQQWEAALKTAESIRTGTPQARLDFLAMPRDELAVFYRRWHPGALAAGRELARRFDFASRRAVLDVAGGSGGVAIALCEAHPHLEATIADVANTTPITRGFVADSGVADRISVIELDAINETPPGTYDAAVMRAFLQVIGPDEARRAVANVARAIEPGGALYISGSGIVDDSRTAPAEIVAYSLVYLNYYEAGRAYSESEYRAMLEAAGFTDVERLRLDAGQSIIAARKARP